MGDVKEQPKCRVDTDGTKEWYFNGTLHREDGPAIEWANGDKYWYLHGCRHREDGPAFECAGGYREWWLHDRFVHPEQVVDYHLIRGTFCYYNEQADTLHFDESE